MPKWKADTDSLENKSMDLNKLSRQLSAVGRDIRSSGNLSRLSFSGKTTMQNRINSLIADIDDQAGKLRIMGEKLSEIAEVYECNENRIKDNSGQMEDFSLTDTPGSARGEASADGSGDNMLSENGEDSGNGSSDEAESKKTSIIDIILNWIEAFLKYDDKVHKDKGSGAAKNLLSYLRKLFGFWTGDKRGWSGASDLCDLAKSSSSLWSAYYKYLASTLPKGEKDFFTSAFGLKASAVGIAGSFFGFLGGIAKAMENCRNMLSEDRIQWAGYTSEGISAASGMADIVKSLYDFKNFDELLKKGDGKLHSEADNWLTLVQTGISTVSQVFDSYSKYYADGVWDMGDTAATGIDSSIAGLEKLISSYSFGIFSAKNFGTTPEEISEGLKSWCSDVGKDIGNYVLQHDDLKEMYDSGNPLLQFAAISDAAERMMTEKAVNSMKNTVVTVKDSLDGLGHDTGNYILQDASLRERYLNGNTFDRVCVTAEASMKTTENYAKNFWNGLMEKF